jgi:hypothetical protein
MISNYIIIICNNVLSEICDKSPCEPQIQMALNDSDVDRWELFADGIYDSWRTTVTPLLVLAEVSPE